MAHTRALIHDWMTRAPATVEPGGSLLGAYKLMRAKDIRRLPVVQRDGHLVGIITRSDVEQAMPFARSESARDDAMKELEGRLVREIMTGDPITIRPETLVRDAARIMIEKKVSGLPVVDANNRVVGLVTESDIFRMLVETWDNP